MKTLTRYKVCFTIVFITALSLTVASCTEKVYINRSGPNNFVGGPLDSVIATGEPLYSEADFAGDTLNSDTGFAEDGVLEPRPADLDNPIWSCVTREVDATKFPDEFPLFDPNAELIYPGNLLQGGSLEKGTPLPIPLKRGSGTVVMTLVNGNTGPSFRDVDEVKLSSVTNAMNEMLVTAPDAFAARFSLSFEEVHSKEQLFFSINASLKYSGIGSAEGSLSFSRDSDIEYNRYMVKLNQSFYTMALEMPLLGETIFHESVSADDLDAYLGKTNPVVYISSVTFGRIFYLLIESTDSKEVIEASLSASFSSGLWSGDVDSELKYVSELSNVRIKAFAMGGDAGEMIGAVTTDFDSMKKFLASSTILTTGSPISYTMRYLHDPAQLVKLKLTTKYDIVDCKPVDQSADFNNIWRYAASSHTGASFHRVAGMGNLFPASGIGAAIPKGGIYAGVSNTSTIFGSTPPITFANTVWSPSATCGLVGSALDAASVEKSMVVEGTKFDSTSYTICAVVGPGIQSLLIFGLPNTPTYPNNFLDLPGKISLGFSSKDSIQFVHNGNVLRAALPETSRDLSDFATPPFPEILELPWRTETTKHLYTFKYDIIDSSMSIYIDNDTTAATTLGSVAPVRTSSSPSLGCMVSNKIPCTNTGFTLVRGFLGNSIHFWEIRAYAQALPGLSLKSVQTEIVDLYKIQ